MISCCADAEEVKRKGKSFFMTKAQKKEQAEARAAEAAKAASRKALEDLQAHKRSMAQVLSMLVICWSRTRLAYSHAMLTATSGIGSDLVLCSSLTGHLLLPQACL